MRTLLPHLAGRLVIACLAGSLLGGCVSTRGSPIDLDPGKAIPKDQVVVFGKFTALDEDGDEIDYGSPLLVSAVLVGYRNEHALLVVDCTRQNAYTCRLEDDGTFFWRLPPGSYEIRAYRHVSGPVVVGTPVRAAFSVPAGNRPVYVGEYRLPEVGSGGPRRVRNQLSVASARLAEEFPEVQGRPTTSLMRNLPLSR